MIIVIDARTNKTFDNWGITLKQQHKFMAIWDNEVLASIVSREFNIPLHIMIDVIENTYSNKIEDWVRIGLERYEKQ